MATAAAAITECGARRPDCGEIANAELETSPGALLSGDQETGLETQFELSFEVEVASMVFLSSGYIHVHLNFSE